LQARYGGNTNLAVASATAIDAVIYSIAAILIAKAEIYIRAL
jgi:hypothetical protein